MNNIRYFFLITLLTNCYLIVSAQGSDQLNQVELNRQILGKWEAKFDDGRVAVMEYKAFGNGEIGSIKIHKGDSLIYESRQLSGFNKELNKSIDVTVGNDNSDATIDAYWFISPKEMIGVKYDDLNVQGNYPNRREFTFGEGIVTGRIYKNDELKLTIIYHKIE